MNKIEFTGENIQRLFGHEAAEDEDQHRLREYYFKTSTYNQTITDLPLRILVGHKGIGKSALFAVARAEDTERYNLSVLLKPDDVVSLGTDTTDFLKTIRDWKEGIARIIAAKVFSSFGIGDKGRLVQLKAYGGKLIKFLMATFKDLKGVSFTPAQDAIVQQFLKINQINVYIDDLDRGWQGRKEDVTRISAPLNAVRDISNEDPGIHFRIALRSDVYFLVRTSDESTDKIEGSVVWHSWSNHEIFVLWVKRIETYFGRSVDEASLLAMHQRDLAHYLDCVVEPRFRGAGHWDKAPMYRVLMSLIRRRPRDLVKLCSLAARKAYADKSQIIRTEHFEAIFEEYSQGRVQDAINEYRSELPDIERLIMNMKPNKKERKAKEGYSYKTDALLAKISNIQEMGKFLFKNGKEASKKDLAAFLYKINFITARKETDTGIIRRDFDESRYLSSQFADFGFDWEVHPAYRWALQPDDVNDLYNRVALTVEDK